MLRKSSLLVQNRLRIAIFIAKYKETSRKASETLQLLNGPCLSWPLVTSGKSCKRVELWMVCTAMSGVAWHGLDRAIAQSFAGVVTKIVTVNTCEEQSCT